jgi:hypothetical protein
MNATTIQNLFNVSDEIVIEMDSMRDLASVELALIGGGEAAITNM